MKIQRYKKEVFNFNKQLKVGEVGENLFIKCYSNLKARKGDGRKTDIFVNENDSIELKTDTWGMRDTPNMFMEYYGDMEKKTYGGPWKALIDNNKYFIYLFIKDKTFFWFDVKALTAYLDEQRLSGVLQERIIANETYYTKGFLVNRDLLKNLVLKKDTF